MSKGICGMEGGCWVGRAGSHRLLARRWFFILKAIYILSRGEIGYNLIRKIMLSAVWRVMVGDSRQIC